MIHQLPMKRFDEQCQVVIMCGISGSGKTHFAQQIEEKGFVRLSTDALIWEKVGDKLFELSKEDQRKLFNESRVEVLRQFVGLVKAGQKIVVDATHCRRSARDDIRRLCGEMQVEPVFVYCHAPKEELWRRLSQRKGEGPDDLIVTEEELTDYWKGFERPQKDETDFIFL